MSRQPQWKWIFGLSIDEDLRWGATRVETTGGAYSIKRDDHLQGYFCDLPLTVRPVDLQALIADRLADLRKSHRDLFNETSAVGISTIGIADSSINCLINIDRKNWRHHDRGYIVNFNSIIPTFFTHDSLKIRLQNDATAKCFAERHWQYRTPNTDLHHLDVLFYAMFHDGVNGGFAEGTHLASDPVAHHMHQELGHVFPPLHKKDFSFEEKFSVCPVHTHCFVGLAGGSRIKRQWGQGMPDASPAEVLRKQKQHSDNPWEIISHYIAHFCWNGILTIPPKRILLGGAVIFPELLPYIRTAFEKLNTYKGRPYIEYEAIMDPNFISLALVPSDVAGVMGALELARRALVKTVEAVPVRGNLS